MFVRKRQRERQRDMGGRGKRGRTERRWGRERWSGKGEKEIRERCKPLDPTPGDLDPVSLGGP